MSGPGPFGPIFSGVWQSLQPPMVTRYFPRATCFGSGLQGAAAEGGEGGEGGHGGEEALHGGSFRGGVRGLGVSARRRGAETRVEGSSVAIQLRTSFTA